MNPKTIYILSANITFDDVSVCIRGSRKGPGREREIVVEKDWNKAAKREKHKEIVRKSR